jgi:ABC-type uncharacterized transport system permease subunit
VWSFSSGTFRARSTNATRTGAQIHTFTGGGRPFSDRTGRSVWLIKHFKVCRRARTAAAGIAGIGLLIRGLFSRVHPSEPKLHFIDTASQLFFREVYRFRQAITTGSFDFYLLRPFSPLFRSLLGGIDILDIPLLFVSLGFIFFSVGMNGHVSVIASILFFLLILNALVIAAAFHIFVLCIGILSTTVDQLLWIYRDLTIFGRVPIAVYQEPIRSLMTFIIPIGIMIAFPAEAVLGVLSPLAIIVAFLMSTILFLSSLLLWRYSLKQYTSASS